MKQPLALLVLAACSSVACTSKVPVRLPADSADADAGVASASAAQRVSHREELLREATTTGLDVVYAGWLDPRAMLGVATQDTCLRVRAAALPDAASAALVVIEGSADAGAESATEFSLHDAWVPPYCVRRGTRITLAAGVSTEVVVVASAPFR